MRARRQMVLDAHARGLEVDTIIAITRLDKAVVMEILSLPEGEAKLTLET